MSARIPEGDGPFSGTLIDRTRTIRFQVNGHTHSGFSGDTVLSALLGGGTFAAGRHGGFALGLGTAFGPDIVQKGASHNPPLPPDMVLAEDMAVYETVEPVSGTKRLLDPARLFRRRTPSMGINFDRRRFRDSNGAMRSARPAISPDLFVVGGGVAGLSSALAGAEAGLDVVLVERRRGLGGDALLFGNRENDTPIAETLRTLVEAVQAHPKIAVATSHEVTHVADGVFHMRGWVENARAALGPMVSPRFGVIATGAADRLPIFAGNRLPYIVGVAEAFHLARNFAVWPQGDTVIAGSANAAYRIALLAQEAGVPAARLFDARVNPQSRFLEFCKAYGLQMAVGSAIRSARMTVSGLSVQVAPTWAEPGDAGELVTCAHLITAGGWAPRLRLWVQAGGKAAWRDAEARLVATGSVDTVAVAGSAADHQTHGACVASGRDAVARLLGRKRVRISDPRLPAEFESRDEAIPAFPAKPGEAPAYLSRGHSLIPAAAEAEAPARTPWLARLGHSATLDAFGKTFLEVEDIEALLTLRELMPATAETVIKERGLPPVRVVASMPSLRDDVPSTDVPPYLAGRFGTKPVICEIKTDPGRRIEAGALIHASSDETDPFLAIGVVLAAGASPVRALICRDQYEPGRRAVMRESSRVLPIVMS